MQVRDKPEFTKCTLPYEPHAVVRKARCRARCVQVLEKPEFTKCMLEKLVWISAFMLAGARHGGCTVGEVEGQVRGWGWAGAWVGGHLWGGYVCSAVGGRGAAAHSSQPRHHSTPTTAAAAEGGGEATRRTHA